MGKTLQATFHLGSQTARRGVTQPKYANRTVLCWNGKTDTEINSSYGRIELKLSI